MVILDSGHNEYVEGKCNGDFKEWDFNNQMQYKIMERLLDHGVEVFLTNPKPEKKDEIGLTKRATLANNYWVSKGKPKAIFISLHGNAYENSKVRGTETFHATNASSNSKYFAKIVNNEIANTIKTLDIYAKDRGVKTKDFTVIYKTSMPSVLIEYAFYSNPDDLRILKNNKDELTEATVKSICRYFSIDYKPIKEDAVNSNTGTQLFAVCVGAYNKTNAEVVLKEVKEKGYTNSYIIPR